MGCCFARRRRRNFLAPAAKAEVIMYDASESLLVFRTLDGLLLTTLTVPRKAPWEDAMPSITRTLRGHERHQKRGETRLHKTAFLFCALSMRAPSIANVARRS